MLVNNQARFILPKGNNRNSTGLSKKEYSQMPVLKQLNQDTLSLSFKGMTQDQAIKIIHDFFVDSLYNVYSQLKKGKIQHGHIVKAVSEFPDDWFISIAKEPRSCSSCDNIDFPHNLEKLVDIILYKRTEESKNLIRRINSIIQPLPNPKEDFWFEFLRDSKKIISDAVKTL